MTNAPAAAYMFVTSSGAASNTGESTITNDGCKRKLLRVQVRAQLNFPQPEPSQTFHSFETPAAFNYIFNSFHWFAADWPGFASQLLFLKVCFRMTIGSTLVFILATRSHSSQDSLLNPVRKLQLFGGSVVERRAKQLLRLRALAEALRPAQVQWQQSLRPRVRKTIGSWHINL